MHYVISDIHGNIHNFNNIMSQINLSQNDRLFILGDIIDRYPDGIQIMQKLINMPNAEILLGNHELMLKNAIRSGKKQDFYLWWENGGYATIDQFEALSETEQNKILNNIEDLPVEKTIKLNGKTYVLAHATCPSLAEYDNNTKDIQIYGTINDYVWRRWKPNDLTKKPFTFIFGHTPTTLYQSNNPAEIFSLRNNICIDCGSGLPETYRIKGRLACLRLEDMHVFYSK